MNFLYEHKNIRRVKPSDVFVFYDILVKQSGVFETFSDICYFFKLFLSFLLTKLFYYGMVTHNIFIY